MEKFEDQILIKIANGMVTAELCARNEKTFVEVMRYDCGDIRNIEAVAKAAVGRVLAEYKAAINKIEVGDTVRIIDNGKSYTTYHAWFERHAPELAVYYSYNFLPANGACGVVKKLVNDGFTTIYAIEVTEGALNGKSLYLVNDRGIQKVR